jgi:hypothetical protein
MLSRRAGPDGSRTVAMDERSQMIALHRMNPCDAAEGELAWEMADINDVDIRGTRRSENPVSNEE